MKKNKLYPNIKGNRDSRTRTYACRNQNPMPYRLGYIPMYGDCYYTLNPGVTIVKRDDGVSSYVTRYCFISNYRLSREYQKLPIPVVGLEPTTTALKVRCSAY